MSSSIIDHSALVSNLFYQEAARHIGGFAGITNILVWSDCGPRYKSYDYVAGWLGDWVESATPHTVRPRGRSNRRVLEEPPVPPPPRKVILIILNALITHKAANTGPTPQSLNNTCQQP